jgi:flagellar motor component MotA
MEYVNNWLEKIIDYETSIFEPNIINLYKKLEDTINEYVANNYNESINILEQLRDNGTSLKELENHLLIYSLKYHETDEGKYNFICDLLDIITGNYAG